MDIPHRAAKAADNERYPHIIGVETARRVAAHQALWSTKQSETLDVWRDGAMAFGNSARIARLRAQQSSCA